MRSVRTLICFLLLAIGHAPVTLAQEPAPPDPVVRFDGHKVVRVQPRSTREMRTALTLTDDVWTCAFDGDKSSRELHIAPIDIRLTPEAYLALRDSQIPFTLLIDDVQKLIDAERAPALGFGPRGPGTFFGAYQDYAAVSAYIDTLAALRPDLASRVHVGASLLPREIFALRVSAPGAPPGSKPAIILWGCQHAREWITVMGTTYIADQLVRNYNIDANIRRLLDSFEFYIVPIANPDGYAYTWTNNRLWRKNRRANGDGTTGVDLNRNWDFGWGGPGSSGTSSSDIYRGPSAFSEPCTQSLRDFIIARPNIAMSFDIHSYSQLVLEPFGYTFALPPETRAYTQITGVVQAAMSASAGGFFIGGETYRAIYPASGVSQDWIQGVRGILGYGFELRDRGSNGFVLPVSDIIPGSQECLAGVFAAANWLIDHPVTASFPAGQPTWFPANSSSTVREQFARGLLPLGDPATRVPTVRSRIGRNGPFSSALLTIAGSDEGGTVFMHDLAAGPCGSVVQWYYSVPLPDGSSATVPAAGPGAPFEAPARSGTNIFSDDFEAERGWIVGDTTPASPDTVTTGIWERTDPNGTQYQPEHDHTPLTGANCFITGQNPRGDLNTGRVGIGKTTLSSPIFGAPGATRLDASMWLWTVTSQVETFTVDVTTNASAPTPAWTRVLTIDPSSPNAQTTPRWNRYTFRLSDLVVPTASMRLRFIARATGSNNVVEIALDDVTIASFSCDRPPCTADYNADGVVTTGDIFDFLADWFAGVPRASTHNPPSIQDIFDFIAAWFLGC